MCPPSGSLQGRASCRPLGCLPRRRRAPAGRRCQVAAGTVRNLLQVLRAAQAPGASAICCSRSEPRSRPALQPRAGTEHNSRGGRPRLAHAAEPPGPLHLHGHSGKLPRAKISGLSVQLTVATPLLKCPAVRLNQSDFSSERLPSEEPLVASAYVRGRGRAAGGGRGGLAADGGGRGRTDARPPRRPQPSPLAPTGRYRSIA
jgi:hypothetical protein